MNKKILLCSNTLWSITQFRLGLIKALVKEGYEVVCIGEANNFSEQSEQKAISAGARIINLPMDRKGTNPWSDLEYFFRLRKILKREKPFLVINYTIKPVIYGSVAARTLHIPSFAGITGLGFVFTKNNMLTRITRILYKFGLKYPAVIFFLNQDDLDEFHELNIIPSSKAMLLPGEGINTSFYQPLPTEDSRAEFIFLLIGRLLKEKGIGEYAEAARMMKSDNSSKVKFRLIGFMDTDNPGAISSDQLQKWTEEGIIEYAGTTEDIRPEIGRADCLVLPSYREGVPRTLLEAASMEKPILTTNTPGCREVVDNGINGFLCEPRNSRDLYLKMVLIMNLSASEREKMGQAGRDKVLRQFDEKIVTAIYLKEIQKILNK